jgi:hypothetical protein
MTGPIHWARGLTRLPFIGTRQGLARRGFVVNALVVLVGTRDVPSYPPTRPEHLTELATGRTTP